jgi:hypothetical protein
MLSFGYSIEKFYAGRINPAASTRLKLHDGEIVFMFLALGLITLS